MTSTFVFRFSTCVDVVCCILPPLKEVKETRVYILPLSFPPLLSFVSQAIQSLFPRLPDSGRGTSLFDRTTAAPGPEGDKLRLDSFPFLSTGEQIKVCEKCTKKQIGIFLYRRDTHISMRRETAEAV